MSPVHKRRLLIRYRVSFKVILCAAMDTVEACHERDHKITSHTWTVIPHSQV